MESRKMRSIAGGPGRVGKRIALMTRGAGWGLTDQAFSSLTNFALGIIVARLVSAAEFGAFTVAFTAFLVALNITRYLGAQPLVIRYSSRPEAWPQGTASALGLVVLLSVAMSGVALAIALLAGGPFGQAMVALALTLPGLLVQDGWRFAFFARGRGRDAFINDLVWTMALAPLLILTEALGLRSVFWLVLAWGSAGTAAAVAGIFQSGIVPDPRLAAVWWREHRDIGPRYVATELASMGATQLVLFAIGAIAGLAAVGSLRAAQLLLGPVNILTMGFSIAALPDVSRTLQRSREEFRRACLRIAVVLVSATVIWGAVALLLPQSAGSSLLGASWPGANLVLLPVTLAIVARVASAAARIGLAAMAVAQITLRVTLLEAGASIVAGVVGAATGGVLGAAWGLALISTIIIVIWWSEYFLAVRRLERSE
jgi:O-antigen/teichoic acid export membrane protein